jgi:hypothetical protein
MHLTLMRERTTTMPTLDEQIVGLRVWHCKFATLGPIARLRRLRSLVIASFPDSSLEMLSELRELRYVSVLHLPKVKSLGPLQRLHKLESLSLATLPSWDASRKTTRVETLAPLGELTSLRHVSLFGVVSEDETLRPLEKCTHLSSARFSRWPKAEVERFYSTTGVSDAHVPEPPPDLR